MQTEYEMKGHPKWKFRYENKHSEMECINCLLNDKHCNLVGEEEVGKGRLQQNDALLTSQIYFFKF